MFWVKLFKQPQVTQLISSRPGNSVLVFWSLALFFHTHLTISFFTLFLVASSDLALFPWMSHIFLNFTITPTVCEQHRMTDEGKAYGQELYCVDNR